MIGEHGDSMVPLVEYASVSGVPITSFLTQDQIERIVRLTVASGSDAIKHKGSTIYPPGAVIAMTKDAVITRRNRLMIVSTCLCGKYGFSDAAIWVPVILGKNALKR